MRQSTLKNLLSLLNRMFQMAIRLNVMESNSARNIDLNGCSNKKPKDKFYLGGELLPGFLASCAERQYGDLYRFVLHTGMTFTETVKLCWEEVDLERGSIAVVGRTRIQRRIPLDEEAKQILMERKNPLHGTMILFLPAGPVARLRSSMWQRNYRNSPKN